MVNKSAAAAAATLLSAASVPPGGADAAPGAGVPPGGADAAPGGLFAPPLGIKARILRALELDGVMHAIDAVVWLELGLAKSLWEQGAVDPHPHAVAHAEGLVPPAAEA